MQCGILPSRDFPYLEYFRQYLEITVSGSKEENEVAVCVHLLDLPWGFSFRWRGKMPQVVEIFLPASPRALSQH